MNKTLRSLLIIPLVLGVIGVSVSILGLIDLLLGTEDTRPSVESIIRNFVVGSAMLGGSIYLRKRKPK